jgi:hypothetical protein
MPRNLYEERERARKLATSIVSWAIMGVGVAFLVMAVVVGLQRDAGLTALALVLGFIGLVTMIGGFFFHLIPSRVDALEEGKREYAARQREAEGHDGATGNEHAPEE